MKREYNAPLIEYLAFSAYENFTASTDDEIVATESFPYNDADLGGWT